MFSGILQLPDVTKCVTTGAFCTLVWPKPKCYCKELGDGTTKHTDLLKDSRAVTPSGDMIDFQMPMNCSYKDEQRIIHNEI
jgi:hypothetical protein